MLWVAHSSPLFVKFRDILSKMYRDILSSFSSRRE
jgi:hypothetical protein